LVLNSVVCQPFNPEPSRVGVRGRSAPRQAELEAARADLCAAREKVSEHRAALRGCGGDSWWLGAMAQIVQKPDGGAAFFEGVLDKLTPISMRRGVAAVPMWQVRGCAWSRSLMVD